MPSTLTVTNILDSGPGSLRAEIAAANSGDTINFASSLDGQTVTLTSGELLINKGLTIQGPGAGQLTVSGNNQSRVFDIGGLGQSIVLSGLTISNGKNLNGGGIYNGGALTVSGCTISNNNDGHPSRGTTFGGGIANHGFLTVIGCTISNNSCRLWGGGIYNAQSLIVSNSTVSSNSVNSAFGDGGGIANTGMVTLTNCTLANNSASEGGGLFVTYTNIGGTARLTNCTLANNSAGYGGGLFVDVSGGHGLTTATLTNCTLSVNSAQYGGGIYVGPGGVTLGGLLNLTNTIVAGNTAGVTPDINGTVATADHNLVGDATGSTGIYNGVNGNIVGGHGNPVNAHLGPLQNNGGPTQTMALLAGSPAIGHADNGSAPATDERGFTRRDKPGELTDIGAFEL
jgi:hypothetical protein